MMKKILALAASAVMLFSFTLQAEAGFNWGGIANKAANKAVDSVLSGGKKQADTNKQAAKDKKQKSEQQTKGDDAVRPQTTGNKATDNVDGSKPTAWVGTLDPLPPAAVEERPDWFDNRTHIWAMTNGRLVAEYENMEQWRNQHIDNWVEPDMFRYEELGDEIRHRIIAIERYGSNIDAGWADMAVGSTKNATYQRAVASNIEPLRKYGLKLGSSVILVGYHPERN